VVMPIVFLAALLALGLAFIGIVLTVTTPLLPILFVVFCVWAVARMMSRPALVP